MHDLPSVSMRDLHLTAAQKTVLRGAAKDPSQLPWMRADTRECLLNKGLLGFSGCGRLALTDLGVTIARTLLQQPSCDQPDPTYRALLYDRITQALAGRSIADAARITLADGQVVDIVCSASSDETRTFTVRVRPGPGGKGR